MPAALPLLALLFTVVIWGIGPVFLRTLSVELGPADHLVIRYAIVAAAYILCLALWGGWRIAGKDWPRLLLVGTAAMSGYNIGSAYGFEKASARLGSLVIGTQPLLIALLAAASAASASRSPRSSASPWRWRASPCCSCRDALSARIDAAKRSRAPV